MPCRVTRNSRGIAYVQFAKPQDAVAAQAALDSSSFQGRLLHVLPASQRPDAPKPELEVRASQPMAAAHSFTAATACCKDVGTQPIFTAVKATEPSVAHRSCHWHCEVDAHTTIGMVPC